MAQGPVGWLPGELGSHGLQLGAVEEDGQSDRCPVAMVSCCHIAHGWGTHLSVVSTTLWTERSSHENEEVANAVRLVLVPTWQLAHDCPNLDVFLLENIKQILADGDGVAREPLKPVLDFVGTVTLSVWQVIGVKRIAHEFVAVESPAAHERVAVDCMVAYERVA